MSLLVSKYQLTGGVLLPPDPDPGVCGVDQQHPHHHRPAAAAQSRLHPLALALLSSSIVMMCEVWWWPVLTDRMTPAGCDADMS